MSGTEAKDPGVQAFSTVFILEGVLNDARREHTRATECEALHLLIGFNLHRVHISQHARNPPDVHDTAVLDGPAMKTEHCRVSGRQSTCQPFQRWRIKLRLTSECLGGLEV